MSSQRLLPHLPVCQLYRWQLGPNMWSFHTTMSLDPIVVTTFQVGFPGKSHGPVTCGFAVSCPEPKAWTTEALNPAFNTIIDHKENFTNNAKIRLIIPTKPEIGSQQKHCRQNEHINNNKNICKPTEKCERNHTLVQQLRKEKSNCISLHLLSWINHR